MEASIFSKYPVVADIIVAAIVEAFIISLEAISSVVVAICVPKLSYPRSDFEEKIVPSSNWIELVIIRNPRLLKSPAREPPHLSYLFVSSVSVDLPTSVATVSMFVFKALVLKDTSLNCCSKFNPFIELIFIISNPFISTVVVAI
ncbi:MAG: hypothetical protein BWY26_00851 [Elusimicrobia bacterium ADurb.Bin231]|nr:MAG: hypothetical protein BWY26_00851 [Elusimicrobia bacterium ADurb.Bin231]